MSPTPQHIQRVYIALTFSHTLAASFIWGINTIFLLDAGLSNLQAFAANAFFTVGNVIFEVPTGIVADTWGRRTSYLLGTLTLALSTLLYLFAWYIHAPFAVWAVTSMLLGLGFTFFSGATEAWLVDALHATGFTGNLESVFGKGQMVGGVAMLGGSVAGGFVAQMVGLPIPYIIRAAILGINGGVAWMFMKDVGFVPRPTAKPLHEMKKILTNSVDFGLRTPSVRWMMLASPFLTGVSFYAFYAAQPLLLQLYGDSSAYGIAGLAAAIVAGAQIAGGYSVGYIHRLYKKRTSLLIASCILGTVSLGLLTFTDSFWIALLLLIVWGLSSAIAAPVHQAYLNGLIPSQQRATVLSFDSLMGSSGGVVVQPILGKVADANGYGASYAVGAMIQLLSLPFYFLARRSKAISDRLK